MSEQRADVQPGREQPGNGRAGAPLRLPPRVPPPRGGAVQPGIPADPAVRRALARAIDRLAAERALIPPLSLEELRRHCGEVLDRVDLERRYADYAMVLLNNAAWRETLAGIPFERRLLLLPRCLRDEGSCRATFDAYGMLCRDCGSCSLAELTREAERLGYAVLIAEGSSYVRSLIESGRVEAIVGVSCMNVLERCFPHMEAAAIPGISIPLLRDGCSQTAVDLEQVREAIHLSSLDRARRLDLDALKATVQSWFEPAALEEIMGPQQGESEAIARAWLARAGKRWRPYLTSCVVAALRGEAALEPRLAVAVECFHKASLIHDDIEDGDELRYGQPTLHAEHGVAVALNAGDFLIGEGYRLIAGLDLAAPVRVAMLAEAARGHTTLARGQGAELCWARAPRPLSSLEVLEIFRQKTAPAFEVALRLGALHAGLDAGLDEVLGEYSEALGIAYQIRDDLEDHAGEGDSHDLRDLRPSLLLAIARKRAGEGAERELIDTLWRREGSYEGVAGELEALLARRGVIAKARELLDAYEQQAIRSLGALEDATLKGLLRRVISKIFGDEHYFRGYCREFEARDAGGGGARSEPAR